jgi:pectin methylesterase-like acyl-CoA thioesterase
VLVRQSLIAGDVDFIFGNARLVIEQSTILSRAGRRSPGERGIVFAPSTAADERLGFLVVDSQLLAEPGLKPQTVALGRAWDYGVAKGEWQPGRSPNGQPLIRDSALGPHLYAWAASTSRRPFAASGEQAARLSEYNNRPEPAGDNAR